MLYSTLWRRGDAISKVEDQANGQQQALKEYIAAEKLARRLLDMSPGDGTQERELMFIHQKIGDVHQGLKEHDVAIQEYGTALTFIQSAFDREPTNCDWRRDLANTHRRMGIALLAKSDTNRALQQLDVALKMLEELAQENRSDSLQSNLAANILEISDVYSQRGDLNAALAQSLRAIRI